MNRTPYSTYYLHKARLYNRFNEYKEYLAFLKSMRALNAEDQLDWFPNELDVNAYVPRDPLARHQISRVLSLPDIPYSNDDMPVQKYHNPLRFPTICEFNRMGVLQYMRWFYYLKYNRAWSNENIKNGVSFLDAWVRFATSKASTLVVFMLTSEYKTYHFTRDLDDVKLLMLYREPKRYEIEFLKRRDNIELSTFIYEFLGDPVPEVAHYSPFTTPSPTFNWPKDGARESKTRF